MFNKSKSTDPTEDFISYIMIFVLIMIVLPSMGVLALHLITNSINLFGTSLGVMGIVIAGLLFIVPITVLVDGIKTRRR